MALPFALEASELGAGTLNAVLACGLAGACLQMNAVIPFVERCGFRMLLALFTGSMALAVLVLAWSRQPTALALAAFLGAVSMQPNISSPAPLEQTVVKRSCASPQESSRCFTRYNQISTLGLALGSFAAGFQVPGGPRAQVAWFGMALMASTLIYAATPWHSPSSSSGQVASPLLDAQQLPLSECRHRRRISGLAALFSVDSFAGGMIMNSIVVHWLSVTWGASEQEVGPLFTALGLITVPSLSVACWLTKHFGDINTMVWTHIPSNLCLVGMTLCPTVNWVYFFLVVRSALGQMDVSARDSFMMKVVDPNEQVACSSIIATARALGCVAGPPVGALLWQTLGPDAPLVFAGLLKCAYDLVLLVSFRSVEGPSEEVMLKSGA